jgi:hypothetical protein
MRIGRPVSPHPEPVKKNKNDFIAHEKSAIIVSLSL